MNDFKRARLRSKIEVVKYSRTKEKEWDTFVQQAKNGHFIFLRSYMDYHSHRFLDESLLFYRKQKLIALLPAHREGEILATHLGLTFGGILSDATMSFSTMREVFATLQSYLSENKIYCLVYKAIPVCYHQIPASEDVAVLTQLGAEMTARDLVGVVNLLSPVKYYKGVKWAIQKAKKAGVTIEVISKYAEFMQIMADVMANKYGLQTAHSAVEIQKLAVSFPNNIELYGVYKDGTLLGGTVLYLSGQVVHAQYLGISPEGKRLQLGPYLLDYIFQKYKGIKKYFSFGTSQDGEYINEGLYYFKESMGARAVLQEQYLLSWKNTDI